MKSAFVEVLDILVWEKLTSQTGDPNEAFPLSSNEFAIDGSYSLKLRRNFLWQLLDDSLILI
jgi:hypothetical protein